jgi:signal transduction histidine kinase
VSRVVDSTLALAQVEIERTAQLERVLVPVPLVLATESSVAQALLNLLVNALEAMQGRPRVENTLVVRTGLSEGRVLLEVSDNGVGIPSEHLPKIFEPFFSTKTAGQGTGMGLSITQQLVAQLGGELRVRSVQGQGATFQILLRPAEG